MPLTTQPFLPIGTALAAMPPRPGAGLPLSAPLLRQARHVAFEFIRLREERYGPDSNQTGFGALTTTTEGLVSFLSTIQAVKEESELLEEAKLAESTLREIRSLWQGDHFFSEPMKSFFEGFMRLNVANSRFGEKLFRGLKTYREQRDAAEKAFLKPFHEYRDQLMAFIAPLRTQFNFSHFEMSDRIKRGLLSKLETRTWKDMQNFYDLVGLRVLLGRQVEVSAAVGMLRGAFTMHEEASRFDESIPYYFKINDVEIHVPMGQVDPAMMSTGTVILENDRGYRAQHVNIRRFNRAKQKAYPTAEVQVKSVAIDRVGEKQHPLSYKGDKRIPPEVRSLLNEYGRAAFDLAVALEDGRSDVKLPEFEIMKLNLITDEALSSDVLDRLVDLEVVMADLIKERVAPAVEAP